MAAGRRPLLEVRLVAARVHADLLLREVELDDTRHAACEELTVVRHDDDARTLLGDEPLEAGEPGFTTSNPSPEITNAWLYRQLERIYTRATAADLDALQSDAERLCADLREATAQLAVAKAQLLGEL